MIPMRYSEAGGTVICEKNLKSKISCQTPFKGTFRPLSGTPGSALIRSSISICFKKFYFIFEVLIEAEISEELSTKSDFPNHLEDGLYLCA